MNSVHYVTNSTTGEQEPRFLTNGESARLSDTLLQMAQSRQSLSDLVRNAQGDVTDASMAIQVTMDTLTYLRTRAIQQTYYEVDLTAYGTILQGEGSMMQSILQPLEYNESDDFEMGNIDTGSDGSRLSEANASMSNQTIPIKNWGKLIRWNLFEAAQCAQRNNWDLIGARMRARAKSWQLGIQDVFFLGLSSDQTNYPGFLNNPKYTIDTTTITAQISSNSNTPAVFQGIVQGLIQSYQAQCGYNTYPDFFVMPADDWNGLPVAAAAAFPIVSMADYLLKAFKQQTSNENFRILPSAYAVPAINNPKWGVNKHIYLLGKKDADAGSMSIPTNLVIGAPGTGDNFNYNQVGYGQYTGYQIYNPLRFRAFQF